MMSLIRRVTTDVDTPLRGWGWGGVEGGGDRFVSMHHHHHLV